MSQIVEVRRTYKYRLYRSKRDFRLRDAINISGIIWNHLTALQKRYYRLTGGNISENRRKAYIARLRMKTTWFAHWRKVGSQAVQAICERHEQVYDNFFNHQGGLPRFRKAQKYTSFTLKQAGWTLRKAEAGKRYHRITIDGTVYKFVFIDRFERTTGKCSGCGHEQAVTLAERIFVCESCGLALGRDHNAALNILEAGRRLILSQSEEDPVYNGASGAHGSFSHP